MFVRRKPTQQERYLFADLIRHGRTAQHLTQEQLSSFLGCSLHWMNDIEQGKCDPTWRDAFHLAAIVKLDPIVFVKEAGLHVPVSAR